IILLQETNLEKKDTRDFLQDQWTFDSIWTSKTAILAGNREINFEEAKKTLIEDIEERSRFFDSWAPEISDNRINILAGVFNVNIDTMINRISQAIPHNDTIVKNLKELIEGLIDTAIVVTQKPFSTFIQKTRGVQKHYHVNSEKDVILEDIGNWHPISLINCDAKIFMKILANRLNDICKKIIDKHQQDFIKGRSIMDTILDITIMLQNQNNQSIAHWSLLLDQKKAFDHINYNYLQKVLNVINFDQKFVTIIQILFNKKKAYITDTVMLPEPFRIERGVRQGDSIPSLLYFIAFKPLLRTLEKILVGIPVQGCHFKTAIYADDLTIGGSFNLIISKYKIISNTKINKAKSIVVPLTVSARRSKIEEAGSFKTLQENELFKILGYRINSEGQLDKSTCPKAIKKLKKL
ncbi:25794_t:CDS:2, partial [Gigaspora rosea]